MVELIQSVLPDRVVQAVPGKGEVGAALAGHRLVGKVSFTGSPRAGAAVLRTAAGNLTPTLMELGGKNPLVVFDDANLHEALLAAVDGGFFNQGEACTARVANSVAGQCLRRVRGQVVRRGEPAAGGRRRRPGHRRRGDWSPARSRNRCWTTQDRRDRRRPHRRAGATARRSPVGRRLLRRADRPERRDPRHAGGPGGDLRPGRHPHSVQRRGRGGAHRQRHAVRTGRRGVQSGRRSGAAREPADPGRAVFVNNYHRVSIGTGLRGGPQRVWARAPQETLAEYGYTKTIRLAAKRDELPSGWRPPPSVAG